MFRVKEEKRLYVLERIWFSSGPVDSDSDIVRYLRSREKMDIKNSITDRVETVISDLTQPVDELLKNATKTIRYEVSKCEKEDVNVTFFTAQDIQSHKGILDEFEQAYMEFAKGINVKMVTEAYQRSKIDNAVESNTIMLSKAEKDGVGVYHVYFCGGKETCLCYSVSNYRDDNSKRNLAGRMNKLLHVKDMEWFQTHGFELYDWGNISSSETPNGIDKFKMSFGGEVKTVYNTFVGNTLKGKILLIAYKLKGAKQ